MDEVVGAPLPTAARVIGVSVERLSRWVDQGLVRPDFQRRSGRRRVWAFSLDELVMGCVVRDLVERVPLRHVRKIVEFARQNITVSPGRLEWASSADEVFVRIDDAWHGSKATNQSRIDGVLDLAAIRSATRSRLLRPNEASGQVEKRRGVKGGREVFAGTRVPVSRVVSYVRSGCTDAEIFEAFPSLTSEDLHVARQRLAG